MSRVDTFHAYVYGTSFWYALRAAARLYDPVMVVGWFRPPAQTSLKPNDLEIYTTWTDGFGLLTLAMMLLVLAGAVPLPAALTGTKPSEAAAAAAGKKPYARAAILATIFHHVTTGYGAYTHWVRPSHHNVAMDIGVYGCAGLALLGVVALATGFQEPTKTTKRA